MCLCVCVFFSFRAPRKTSNRDVEVFLPSVESAMRFGFSQLSRVPAGGVKWPAPSGAAAGGTRRRGAGGSGGGGKTTAPVETVGASVVSVTFRLYRCCCCCCCCRRRCCCFYYSYFSIGLREA